MTTTSTSRHASVIGRVRKIRKGARTSVRTADGAILTGTFGKLATRKVGPYVIVDRSGELVKIPVGDIHEIHASPGLHPEVRESHLRLEMAREDAASGKQRRAWGWYDVTLQTYAYNWHGVNQSASAVAVEALTSVVNATVRPSVIYTSDQFILNLYARRLPTISPAVARQLDEIDLLMTRKGVTLVEQPASDPGFFAHPDAPWGPFSGPASYALEGRLRQPDAVPLPGAAVIYVDGSVERSSGYGAVAWYDVFSDASGTIAGRELWATSSDAELAAIRHGVQHGLTGNVKHLSVLSDCQTIVYLVRRGAKGSVSPENEAILNYLRPLVDDGTVNILWVRGHAQAHGNAVADGLAYTAMNAHRNGHHIRK